MKGLRRSKRLLSHKLLGDSNQENKGEDLHVLADDVDDDDEEEDDIDRDRARPRKSATEGIFTLTDLNRLALKPGLTTKELANGFWNLQGRLEEDDPKHNEPQDTFVKNIILGRNLEVFLEVSKSLSFGKGMLLQLLSAAVRVGDEDAVVRLVSLLHRRRHNKLNFFNEVKGLLQRHMPNEVPHWGVRGVVKEIVRLKIVKPSNKAVTTTYSCRNFIENFNVLDCSKQALIAIDDVLGPEVWDIVRCDKAIAAEIEDQSFICFAEEWARNGALEFLLRHNALVLTPKLCSDISTYVRTPTLHKDSPHILSLAAYYQEAGFPIMEAESDKEGRMFIRIRENIWYGEVDLLHSLLELCVPAESSCTVREDGLLDEPHPPPHIVEKRAEMVLDAISTHCILMEPTDVGLPLQHYLFHELQLDIERVCAYCVFRVIFLGPTSPPALVDKVLQIVHANVPKLDIDEWKELLKQDVYPVPAYVGKEDSEGVQSPVADKMEKFRDSLEYFRRSTRFAHGSWWITTQTPETLEYLRPWYRVFSATLSEETKLSMVEAMTFCSTSDLRAQAMVEADMIRISDEPVVDWCQRNKPSIGLHNSYLSNNLFPIYFKWYTHTKDQDVRRGLQAVLFATACATNRISEAKEVLLDMLQPSSEQDPWLQVSCSRAYLLTMAACTRNLPFVKWVLLQIQAAFPPEPHSKLEHVGHVSGPDRTKIEWRNHKLTMPAWLDFMMIIIPVKEVTRFRGLREEEGRSYDPLLYLTDHALDPPCPKYLMETGLLLAQTDPLAVLPLIFRIIIMKQKSIYHWARRIGFYDSQQEKHNARDDDNDDDDEEEETGPHGANPAWAWGPITLVKLIELIADETNATAATILNAKEQIEGIEVKGNWVFSLK